MGIAVAHDPFAVFLKDIPLIHLLPEPALHLWERMDAKAALKNNLIFPQNNAK